MIESMKKITLLIYHNTKDQFLKNLQQLGVMHLETNGASQSEGISKSKDLINRLYKAKRVLVEYKNQEDKPAINMDLTAEDFLATFENDKDALDALILEKEALRKEMQIALPFGAFDKAIIDKIKKQGLNIKVFSTTKKTFASIDQTKLACDVIYEEGNVVYFATVYSDEEDLKQIKGALEEKFPERDVTQIKHRENELVAKISQYDEKMAKHAYYLEFIEEQSAEEENKLYYELATASLDPQVDGKVLIITGFYPEKIENTITDFLDKEDVAYITQKPDADEDVPVKLKNNKLAKLFEPVGGLFSLPNYFEVDVVPFFAPFFAFYFGFCLGDVGYGIIIFVLALVAMLKIKNKAVHGILKLGIILGLCTALGGFMLNTLFGTSIVEQTTSGDVVAKISVFESLKNYVTFKDPTDRNGPMIFAILLGVVQLTLGYLISAYNRVKSCGIQGLFQPLGTIAIMIGAVVLVMLWMYAPTAENPFNNFCVGPMPVGEWLLSISRGDATKLGSIMTIVTAVGVALVLLFNNVEKNVFIRPVTGLWEMYNTVTGLLSDLLSYIRLFALGLAGGLLGSAFNDIALMVKDAFPGGIVVMVLIMVVGHTLNFLLSAIGAFVHPLRLTFVEFYKAVGFTGGGKPFVPFSNKNINK